MIPRSGRLARNRAVVGWCGHCHRQQRDLTAAASHESLPTEKKKEMAVFVIADIEITDPVRYEEYKRLAAPTVAAPDGKLGAST